MKEYAASVGVNLILEDFYGLDKFVCEVAKLAAEDGADATDAAGAFSARCAEYCYPRRLRKVFEYAAENGYYAVSTTLLYSIYQQHDVIRELCSALAREFGVEFVYRDFRKGWAEGQAEARAAGLYMQKYCGCVFSEEESFIGREISRDLRRAGVSPTNTEVRKVLEKAKSEGEVDARQATKAAAHIPHQSSNAPSL